VSIFFVFFFFILGLFFGSFLNLISDRLSRNEKITGRSYCENCKKTLSWKDLIPLLSFVWLKGKCRYCHVKLSNYYLFSEILTGILFVLTFIYISTGTIFPPKADQPLADNFQFSIAAIYYFFIISAMIVIFFADLRHGIIPDKVVLSAVTVTLAWLLFINHQSLFINHLISAAGAFLFFLFLFLITKGKGMGFGDVKLSFLMGLVLGYPGVFYSIYLAFLTGGAFAIILLLWKKKELKSQVAFGPFLVASFLLVLYFQPQIDRLLGLLL